MSETASNEVINICGVLVHARPDRISQVRQQLEQFAGVEVHNAADDGRLVVTVDHPDRHHMIDTINEFNNVEGVLSTAMVYQHTE